MKIQNINIQNVLGIKSFNHDLPAPITVIAGHNKVGKSSILESINLALTGDFKRVSKKKDFTQLVHNQAKKGTVKIDTDKGKFNINLPTGSGKICEVGPLELSLNHGYFSSFKLDNQISIITKLTGVKLEEKTIKELLFNEGFDEVLTMRLDYSKLDFDNLAKQANEIANDQKCIWFIVT